MLRNRKLVKSNAKRVRFNDYVIERIERIVEETGGETAVIIHDLVIKGLELHEKQNTKQDE